MWQQSKDLPPYAVSVIAYNPDDEQIERMKNLSAIAPYLIVADNSEQPAEPIEKSDWIEMVGNKGVGAALNACAQRALEMGYDWLLTLDQDTEIDKETLDTYIEAFRKFDDKDFTAVAAPLLDDRDGKQESEGSVRDLDLVMTSCNLLNLHIWKDIGGFTEELFIDEVDHEYCLNARWHGYRVVRLLDARIRHYPGHLMTLETRHGPTLVSWHPPKRLFYIARNYWYIKRKYGKVFPGIVRERGTLVKAKYKEYLRYHPNKLRSLWALVSGTFDGFLGNFGR